MTSRQRTHPSFERGDTVRVVGYSREAIFTVYNVYSREVYWLRSGPSSAITYARNMHRVYPTFGGVYVPKQRYR